MHILAKELTVTLNRAMVIHDLNDSYERHHKIVREAYEGYREKAREVLEDRLRGIGDTYDDCLLSFDLDLPISHLATYRAVISALEVATGETIELTLEQQQAFTEDRWDWSESFIQVNAQYSEIAAGLV